MTTTLLWQLDKHFFVKRNCLYLQRPMPQWTCIPILGATNLMPACVSVLSGLNSSSCLGSFVDCLPSLHHTGKHPGLKGHNFLLTTSPNREVNKKRQKHSKNSPTCVLKSFRGDVTFPTRFRVSTRMLVIDDAVHALAKMETNSDLYLVSWSRNCWIGPRQLWFSPVLLHAKFFCCHQDSLSVYHSSNTAYSTVPPSPTTMEGNYDLPLRLFGFNSILLTT